MFDENNSIGIKYSIQGSPRYDSKLYTTSKVSLDGKVFDRLQNFTSSETDNELNHQLNAYYSGRVGNLEIRLQCRLLSKRLFTGGHYWRGK